MRLSIIQSQKTRHARRRGLKNAMLMTQITGISFWRSVENATPTPKKCASYKRMQDLNNQQSTTTNYDLFNDITFRRASLQHAPPQGATLGADSQGRGSMGRGRRMILCAILFAFFSTCSIFADSEWSDFYFTTSAFIGGIYFCLMMLQIKADCGL